MLTTDTSLENSNNSDNLTPTSNGTEGTLQAGTEEITFIELSFNKAGGRFLYYAEIFYKLIMNMPFLQGYVLLKGFVPV